MEEKLSHQERNELNVGEMLGKEFDTREEAYTVYNQYICIYEYSVLVYVRIHDLTNAIYRRQ